MFTNSTEPLYTLHLDATNLYQNLTLFQREEERLRASIRRENQQRRVREKSHSRGLSASYLEPDGGDYDDDEEAGISITAIKKGKGGGGMFGGRGKYIRSTPGVQTIANIFWINFHYCLHCSSA